MCDLLNAIFHKIITLLVMLRTELHPRSWCVLYVKYVVFFSPSFTYDIIKGCSLQILKSSLAYLSSNIFSLIGISNAVILLYNLPQKLYVSNNYLSKSHETDFTLFATTWTISEKEPLPNLQNRHNINKKIK